MAFWGVEVRPGRPFTHPSDGGNRRLHVSQASLGNGTGTNKSVLQCNVGIKRPVWLCSLFPNSSEVCQIHVEYQETEDVIFSVIGPRSIHLSGYYTDHAGNHRADDDSESYGEDIGDQDTDRSDHDSDEDLEDSFINDSDPGVMSASPVSSDGEDAKTKPVKRNGYYRRLRKTYQLRDSDDGSSSDHQAVGIGDDVDDGVDSEDLIPLSSLCKKKLSATVENEADLPSNNHASEEEPGGGNHTSHLDELKSEMVDKSGQEKLHEADGVDDFFSGGLLKLPKLEEKEKKDDKVGNEVSLFKDVDEETACRGSPPKHIDLQKGEKRKRKRKAQVEESASQGKCDNSSTVIENGENQELKPSTLDGDLPSPAKHNKDNSSFSISINVADQVVSENDQEGNKPMTHKTLELGKPLNAGVSVSSKTEEELPNPDGDAVEVKSSEQFGGQSVDEKPEGKKKKSKRQKLGKHLDAETPVPLKGEDNQPANIEEAVAEIKLSQVQAFPGGLLVEELEPGKKKGRVAAPGKKISVSYTGKWKSTGVVLNLNVNGRPLKFVLGGEGVMEAWNVGLNGMRAGGTRRLTIPAPLYLRSRSSSSRQGKVSEGGGGGGEAITTRIPPLPQDCDIDEDDTSEGGEKSLLVYDIKLLKVRK